MVGPSHNPRQQQAPSSGEHDPSDKKYRGVRKRAWGKYVSEIRLPNSRERIWLGSYDTAEKAARAFDAALYCLRGGGARFNFPSDPPSIENGRSMTPSEIQVAAARFAHSREHVADSGSDDTQSEASDAPLWSRADSPPYSVSGGVPNLEYEIPEMPLDGGFLDQFGTLGTGSDDVGLFPEFNEYIGTADYFVPPLPGADNSSNHNNYNNWHESNNYDDITTQGGSFLWNF